MVAPSHWLAWVMLVPWLGALDRTATWRGALASGVAMAMAFSIAIFAWFPVAIADYAGASLWLVSAVALVAAPLFQPQLVVFALARHAARRRRLEPAALAVTGASAWVATEWLLPKLFGDTIGLGLYPSPSLRQLADVAGPPGLTLVVVLGNECVGAAFAAIREPRRVVAPLATLAALVLGLALYGQVRVAMLAVRRPETPLTVGVVQANLTHYDRLAAEVGTYEAVRRILDAHFAGSEEALGRGPLDVLVWPETVYPTTFGTPKSADGAAFDREIAGLVVGRGRPLIFGSYDTQDGREYNAAVFLAPDGHGGVTFDTYRKATLFPLTEEVPAWLDGPRVRARLPWLGSWHPGAGEVVKTLALAGGRRIRVAPLICYDAVRPQNVARAVRAGAELIVTLSNDSWLGSDGARLHFVVSLFRSIETRRPQIRATTTGISAIISPTGDIQSLAPPNQQAVLLATIVPVKEVLPLAVRWGDWLGPVATAIAAILLAIGNRRPR